MHKPISAESCRRSAARNGWTVRPLAAPHSTLFVRNGHVFTASFPVRQLTAEERREHRALRRAGVSAYVVESLAEWSAILDYEARHAAL